MTDGKVSDIDGDDTLLDDVPVRVEVRTKNLPPEQAFAVVQEGDASHIPDEVMGRLARGKKVDERVYFDLPLGAGLTALASVGAIDLPEQPPDDTSEVEQQT